jgi:hypothetical protein
MEADVADYRSRRGRPQTLPMHAAAVMFARAAGVEPDLERWPELGRALLFGPLSAVSFRLSGRDALDEAPQRFAEEVRCFGCMTSNEPTPMQIDQLQALAGARANEGFSRFVAAVCPG